MQTRRFAIALAGAALAVALSISPLARSEAETEHPASTFLDTMRERAISGLTDNTRSDEEREALFRGLLNETFDIQRIGRFVVGRYWRQADAKDQEAFLKAFEDAIVQRFLPLFAQYKGEQLIIGEGRPDTKNPKFTVVTSTYIDAQGREVKTDWRLLQRDGKYKVFDVLVEGVSMAITLRSEYASVIKQRGGLPGLVVLLREKLAKGEFKPAVAAE
ncbi:MAG: ABC transporter substrate-binding protein [Kiloniellales bacterium]|nr:ABC transporter substrate-binding protein [Kiloniellales bacterium]